MSTSRASILRRPAAARALRSALLAAALAAGECPLHAEADDLKRSARAGASFHRTGDGSGPRGPGGAADESRSNTNGAGSGELLAHLDTDRIRDVARQAVAARLPNLDLTAFDAGYTLCLADARSGSNLVLLVEWIGRETLALARGTPPAPDRKQVRKVRVRLTARGETLGVEETTTWLERTAR